MLQYIDESGGFQSVTGQRCRSLFVEVIGINLLDLVGSSLENANIVVDHVLRERCTINENDLAVYS